MLSLLQLIEFNIKLHLFEIVNYVIKLNSGHFFPAGLVLGELAV